MWYKKDDFFQKPKAVIAAKILTSDLGLGTADPRATLFAKVWKETLLESMREYLYLAKSASLTFTVELNRDSIDLTWSGYNDSLVNFIAETLARFKAFENVECGEIFAQVKESLH